MASGLTLTSLQLMPQEQSTSQLRRLIVRLSPSIPNLVLTKALGGTSNLWKGYNCNTLRYV